MDEILRARKLTEEILARALSIQTHMSQVNRSMANMALMEVEQKARAAREVAEAAKPPLRLMDLPDDLLHLVAAWAGVGVGTAAPGPDGAGSSSRSSPGPPGSGASSLAALAITCRRWRRLTAGNPRLWQDMCRQRWGIKDGDARSVLVLEPWQLHLAAGWPAAACGTAGGGSGAGGFSGGPRVVLAGVRVTGACGVRAGRLSSSAAGVNSGPTKLAFGGAGSGRSSGASLTHGSQPSPTSPARLRGSAITQPGDGRTGGGSKRPLLPALNPSAHKGSASGSSTAQQRSPASPSRVPWASGPSPPASGPAFRHSASASAPLVTLLTLPATAHSLGPSSAASQIEDMLMRPAAGVEGDLRRAPCNGTRLEDPNRDDGPTGESDSSVACRAPHTGTHGSFGPSPPIETAGGVGCSLTSPRSPALDHTASAAGAGSGQAVGGIRGSGAGRGMAQLPAAFPGGDALEPVPLGWLLRPEARLAAGSGAGDSAVVAACGDVHVRAAAAMEAPPCGSGTGVAGSADVVVAAAADSSEDGGERGYTVPNPWQWVYRDRLVGWRGVMAVFRWLHSHGCPSAVSGALHRQQLLLALRYLHTNIEVNTANCGGYTTTTTSTTTHAPAQGAAGVERGADGAGVEAGAAMGAGATARGCAPASNPSCPGAMRDIYCPSFNESGGGGGTTALSGATVRAPRRRTAEALAAELLVVAPDMVPCLVALLANDSGLVVELAAAGLADLLALDPDILEVERDVEEARRRAERAVSKGPAAGGGKRGSGGAARGRLRRDEPTIAHYVLLASNSGRAIAAQLREGMRSPGIVRQVTRCLVNLWSTAPVPWVLPFPHPPPPRTAAWVGTHGPQHGALSTSPPLKDGVWQLQEFSARGDTRTLIHTIITFRLPALDTDHTAAAHGAPRWSKLKLPRDPRVNQSGTGSSVTEDEPFSPPSESSPTLPSGLVPEWSAATCGSSNTRRSTYSSGMPLSAVFGNRSAPGGGGSRSPRQSWAGEQVALPYGLLPLMGPDGRPLGGTAAALLALGGGVGARWGTGSNGSIACAGGGGGQFVELLGGGYEVMLPTDAVGPVGGTPLVSWSPHEAEEFRLSGWLDLRSGEWRMQRRFINVPYALTYSGHSDAHGCWGIFTAQGPEQGQHQPAAGGPSASAAASVAATNTMIGPSGTASSRRLKLFRLFRNTSLQPPQELMRLLETMRDDEAQHADGTTRSHSIDKLPLGQATEDDYAELPHLEPLCGD